MEARECIGAYVPETHGTTVVLTGKIVKPCLSVYKMSNGFLNILFVTLLSTEVDHELYTKQKMNLRVYFTVT